MLQKLACELIMPWQTYLVVMFNLVNPSLHHKIDAYVRWGEKEKTQCFLFS